MIVQGWTSHPAGNSKVYLREVDDFGRRLGIARVGRRWQWQLQGPRAGWVHGEGTARTAWGARRAADRFTAHHVLADVFEEEMARTAQAIRDAAARDGL